MVSSRTNLDFFFPSETKKIVSKFDRLFVETAGARATPRCTSPISHSRIGNQRLADSQIRIHDFQESAKLSRNLFTYSNKLFRCRHTSGFRRKSMIPPSFGGSRRGTSRRNCNFVVREFFLVLLEPRSSARSRRKSCGSRNFSIEIDDFHRNR
jgi:hypothetical protein